MKEEALTQRWGNVLHFTLIYSENYSIARLPAEASLRHSLPSDSAHSCTQKHTLNQTHTQSHIPTHIVMQMLSLISGLSFPPWIPGQSANRLLVSCFCIDLSEPCVCYISSSCS